jgi:hypothetical protein
MSTDVFAGLDAIHAFLLDHAAAAVPHELRSEVRASAKLVAEIAREIDALPALLQSECMDMLELSEQAGESIAFPTQAAEQPMGSLRGLIRLHEELKMDAEYALLRLQELIAAPDLAEDARSQIIALQDRYLGLLAAQADARIPWQSVFPPLGSTGFTSSGE